MPNPNQLDERTIDQNGGVFNPANISGLEEAKARAVTEAPTKVTEINQHAANLSATEKLNAETADTQVRKIPVVEGETALGGVKIEVKRRPNEVQQARVGEIPKF